MEQMGALVTRVLEGTPAAKAGQKAGDIVLKYDGRGVAGVAKFRASVAATKPGSSVKVLVLRNGKRKTLTVKIEKLAGSGVAASGGGGPKELGLSVQDLTPELSKSLGVKAKGGVAVGGVAEGSPAADKGITKGDVIIELNSRRVKNAADFEAVLARANLRKGVLLLIVNRKGSRFVVLKNAAKK